MKKLRLSLPAFLAMAGACLFTLGAVVPCPRLSSREGRDGGDVSAAEPMTVKRELDRGGKKPVADGVEKDPALVAKW